MAGTSYSSHSLAASSLLARSEEHTSELQSPCNLVCRLLLEKKKKIILYIILLNQNNHKHPTMAFFFDNQMTRHTSTASSLSIAFAYESVHATSHMIQFHDPI